MSYTDYQNAVNYSIANTTGFVNLARSSLSVAMGAVAEAGFGDVTWKSINPLPSPTTDALPTLPTLEAPELNLPGAPGAAPALQEIGSVAIGSAPTNTASKPTFDFGTVPAALTDAPFSPEVTTTFDFPSPPAALSNNIAELAEFVTHTLPETPQLLVPEFSSPEPERPQAPPTDGEAIMARNYTTMSQVMRENVDGYVTNYIRQHSPNYFTQMSRIETQLAKYLGGGTGLATGAEEAIYNRARARNEFEAKKVQDATFADVAARGFTLPSGALTSALARARQDAANNANKTSNEIVVMQAEMEQKNLQFAVTTTSALHDAMRNSAIAYMNVLVSLNGQAMDYAKSVFANVVALYNASLAYYSTQVEVFKTNATVFQTRLQAEMAKLEVFKGEVAAFEALNQADKTKAEVYSARLSALNVLGNVYKTQVDATIAKASLQKLKLELFQAEVQAFSAQAQAKNAEWSGYNARISGEEAKGRIYSSELAAYNSELDAFKATIAAKTMEIDMVSKTNQALSSNYDSVVRSYVAQVSAESTRSNAQNENNRMVMTEFQKQLSGFMAKVNLELEQYKAENEVILKNATADLTAQVEMARAKSQYGATIAQLSNDGAQIYGQLAGSAMAGMNTLAALTTAD